MVQAGRSRQLRRDWAVNPEGVMEVPASPPKTEAALGDRQVKRNHRLRMPLICLGECLLEMPHLELMAVQPPWQQFRPAQGASAYLDVLLRAL